MTGLESRSSIRSDWDRDGYVIVRGLFDSADIRLVVEDAERVEEACRKLVDVKNIRCRWQDNIFTGECQFDAFDPIIDLSEVCSRLAHDPRLRTLLTDLYGEPPCLFKDKLIFKRPGAKGYGLHQDWIAWERFPRSFVSVVIPLDSSDEDNGCTIVYPGYHREGPLTPSDGNYHELPDEIVDEARAVPLLLEPGDVAVFHGFTPHRSNPNLTDRSRRQLYFSYTRQSDGGELREDHYDDFKAWLTRKYTEYGKTDTYFA